MKILKPFLAILFAALLSFSMNSCVSVNPATKNFSVTSDILEVWINGVPYIVEDKQQHYRDLLKKGDTEEIFFYIEKAEKGDHYVVVSNKQVNSDTTLSPESNSQYIKVMISQADYYERPWRK